MKLSSRGAVDPVTLTLIVVLGLTGAKLAGWHPLDAFKKKPPTEQLTQLQAERDAAVKAAEEARAKAEAVAKAEREKTEAEVRDGQQYVAGAAAAIAAVPDEHRTVDVQIADSFLQDAQVRFAAAVGDLPKPMREEILRLWQQLRSGSEKEIAEAKRQLAQKDAEFAALQAETDRLRVELPVWREKAVKAEETAKEAQSKVTVATNEVKTWAQKTQKVLSERSSLVASLERLALWGVGIYVFLVIGIPAIVKHLDSKNPLKTLLRNVSGYTLNPLTYHDAKKKLDAVKKTITTTP